MQTCPQQCGCHILRPLTPLGFDVLNAAQKMRDIATFNVDSIRAAAMPHPQSTLERLKDVQAKRNTARVATEHRRNAVALAVRASDGSREDVAALAVLFAELARADDELRALDGLVERLAAEAKAGGERHG